LQILQKQHLQNYDTMDCWFVIGILYELSKTKLNYWLNIKSLNWNISDILDKFSSFGCHYHVNIL